MTRRHPSYTGPLCPANPEHGPLLSWAGTSGMWCPHSDHALPPSERKPGAPAETVRWFTLDEVEAAQAKLLAGAST